MDLKKAICQKSKQKKKHKQEALFDSLPQSTSYYERRLNEDGVKFVAGVDEVGRGCLAGPVLAAAVILPFPCNIQGITDSKKLTPKKREELFDVIMRKAVSVGFGLVESLEIDEINILKATQKAMLLAVESLKIKPNYLLIDGIHSISAEFPQLLIPKGDYKSISIGAASIVAKVKRDRLMSSYERKFSNFGFSIHKGYGTARHIEELAQHGPTPIHRMTFRKVKPD